MVSRCKETSSNGGREEKRESILSSNTREMIYHRNVPLNEAIIALPHKMIRKFPRTMPQYHKQSKQATDQPTPFQAQLTDSSTSPPHITPPHSCYSQTSYSTHANLPSRSHLRKAPLYCLLGSGGVRCM